MGNILGFLKKLFTKRQQQPLDKNIHNITNDQRVRVSFIDVNEEEKKEFANFKTEIKIKLDDARKIEKKYSEDPNKEKDLEKKIADLIKFYEILLSDNGYLRLYVLFLEENYSFPVINNTTKGYKIENYDTILKFFEEVENYNKKKHNSRNKNMFINDEILEYYGGKKRSKSKAKRVVAPGRNKRTTKKNVNKR